MRHPRNQLFERAAALLAAILLIAACGQAPTPASSTQPDKEIKAANLFTPTSGWVLTTNRLLTTSNGGRTWVDVTPPGGGERQLETAFFLSPSQAWAVVRSTQQDAGNDSARLEMFRSSDGARHWTAHQMPATMPIDTPGPVYLSFVDTRRGWMVVDQGSHAGFMHFKGFSTTDGGDTWKPASFPQTGPILFIDQLDGFSSGTESGNPQTGTYATRDGGRSWRRLDIQRLEVGSNPSPVFQMPVFSNPLHGVIAGRVADPTGSDKAEVFYETSDGGQSWTLDATLPNPKAGGVGQGSVIGPNDWLAAFSKAAPPPVTTSMRFRRTRDGGQTWEALPFPVPGWLTQPISFAGSTGWGIFNRSGCRGFKTDCFSQDVLLRTDDGGTTWRPLMSST